MNMAVLFLQAAHPEIYKIRSGKVRVRVVILVNTAQRTNFVCISNFNSTCFRMLYIS